MTKKLACLPAFEVRSTPMGTICSGYRATFIAGLCAWRASKYLSMHLSSIDCIIPVFAQAIEIYSFLYISP